jgi:DNA integrity scanning protein DisA with diadenylate cyclase activity
MKSDLTTITPIIYLALQALSTLCFLLIAFIVKSFKATTDETIKHFTISIDSIKDSVNNLNNNLAVLIEKDVNKDIRLGEQRKAIEKIEDELIRVRSHVHDYGNEVGGIAKMNQLQIESLTSKIDKVEHEIIQYKINH